ncbi:MAG TPA: TIGR04211 family SH3 domain-containing protein [Gammaproteobacteria bacterium]|nr:TIGR04211 family SH3 domain-containing protein [Gammaproteobacteria bacterium]
MKRLILALGLCLLAASPAWSQATQYITDQLQVTLRSGPTNGHRILRMMDAGTPVQRVGAPEDGWVQVATRDGLQGWVLERHLMNAPSARSQLETLTTRLQRAQQEIAELKQNLAGGSQQISTSQAKIKELTAANERMTRQLEDAARGLTLANENRDLKKQIVDLQRDIEGLQNESERLRDRSQRDWFIVGALVVFGGFLTGIIVTRIRWRKQSSWSSSL